MNRRAFLTVSGLAPFASGGCSVGFPLSPWHMWGTSQTFQVGQDSNFALIQSGVQLCKAKYARPETWSFMLAARLVGGVTPVGVPTIISVDFGAILGVGRSNVNIQAGVDPAGNELAFARFVWSIPVGTPPGQQGNNEKWCTEIRSPILDDTDATTFQTCQWLVADDLQVYARAGSYLGDAGSSVAVEVTAMVAPRSHVRPEWFRVDGEQFRGQEDNGS